MRTESIVFTHGRPGRYTPQVLTNGSLRGGVHRHDTARDAGNGEGVFATVSPAQPPASPGSSVSAGGGDQSSAGARAPAASPAPRPRKARTVGVRRPRGRGGPILGLGARPGAAGGRESRVRHDDGGSRCGQGPVGVCADAERRADRRLLGAGRVEGGAASPRPGAAFSPAHRRPPAPGLGAERREGRRCGRERGLGDGSPAGRRQARAGSACQPPAAQAQWRHVALPAPGPPPPPSVPWLVPRDCPEAT